MTATAAQTVAQLRAAYDDAVNDYELNVPGSGARVFETCEALKAAEKVTACEITSEIDCARRDCELHYMSAPLRLAPEHVDYPHDAGYLFDCPACEARCHCAPGQAECVFSGPHRQAHRAYRRHDTAVCYCTEYGRDHVARLEEYDADPAA